MPEPLADAGVDYLEELLRAAMHTPAAQTDPTSGRVVARLMVALAARREDARLEPYLSCSRGRRSVHEVTCHDDAGRPVSRVSELAAGQAVRAATGFAAARPDRTVAVVARDDAGRERQVLVVRGTTATYQFAEGTVDDDGPLIREPASPAGVPGPAPEQWLAIAERLASLPTTDEVVNALHDRIGRMTVSSTEPSDPAPAQWLAIAERLALLPTTDEMVDVLHDRVGRMTVELRERLGSVPTTDEIITAVRELLAGMTIELDAAAVEDVIVAALDELHQVAPVTDLRGTAAPGPDHATVSGVVAAAQNWGVQAPVIAPPHDQDAPEADTAVAAAGVQIDGERIGRRTLHPPRAPLPAASAQVVDRPAADRAIDDGLSVVDRGRRPALA